MNKKYMIAKRILDNSDLLIKSNCMIVNDVLYEFCEKSVFNDEYDCWRFFIDEDDYDYVEDKALIAKLNALRNIF